MAKLYLIRHAQSANNVIWNGSDHAEGRTPDPEITEIGHRQAQVLGQHLAHPLGEPRQHPFDETRQTHFGIDRVYCSLMSRSILTAQYIAEACDLPLQAQSDIFEQHGIYDIDQSGEMRGLAGPGRDYFETRFPALGLPDEMNPDGWWSRPAEDNAAFIERMQAVVNRVKAELQGEHCVAMVAHGDFIDQFINELMQVDRHLHNYQNHWVANWAFHNTSISRIDFVGGSHNVVYLNRIDHLPAELISW